MNEIPSQRHHFDPCSWKPTAIVFMTSSCSDQ